MALATEYEPIQTSRNGYRLNWAADTGKTFYVWRDSALIGTTTNTYFDVWLSDGEVAVFDIYNASTDIPDYNQPCRAVIWWQASNDLDSAEYIVEEYVSGTWTERGRVPDDDSSLYSWTTDVLTNETTYQFRITPVGDDGNEGTPLIYSMMAVRRPDPVVWDYTWDYGTDTFTVTVSAEEVYAVACADSFALGDTVTQDATFVAACVDSFAMGDAVSEMAIFAESLTDSFALGDSVAQDATYTEACVDSFVLSDAVSEVSIFAESLTDSFAMGDTVSEVTT